ncbi:MAG: hypothetical protein AB7U85_07160 [Alphaproteobacteria bacterium]
MINNSIKFKITVFALLFNITTINHSFAASAVAYGTKSVYSSSNLKNITDAVQNVLENCSKTDNNCVLLLKCEKAGFGASFTERVDGLITSIGATCGVGDAETAKQNALNSCLQNDLSDDCVMRTFWEDKIEQ